MSFKLVRLNPFTNAITVKKVWTLLEQEAEVSFFNSWGWISTWLNCLPDTTQLELIINYIDNQPVCCFFLGVKKGVEHKIFNKKRGYLNNTGHEKYDDLVVEYNSILCNKNIRDQQLALAINHLADIKEFRLPISTNFSAFNRSAMLVRTISQPSYWINLTQFEQPENYLAHLSKNKRSQIKRSLKEYETQGGARIQFAKTADEAKLMFNKLESLHQQEWIKRGKEGAFAKPFFKEFHQSLIETRFEAGEIQLVRIYTDTEDIGYLYNFIFNNEVLFYQSGFSYKQSNYCRPGLISHYLTVLSCITAKYNKYNFLAGSTLYKKSLSTDSDQLDTIIIARKSFQSYIELFLRSIKTKFHPSKK
ncbi:MAG: hypothetical protein ACJAS9_003257 [Polaribacter sp.]|jgi:hypothetical protein